MKHITSPKSIYQVLVKTDEALAWLVASLAPWASIQNPSPNKAGKVPLPYATYVAREGIKENNRVCDFVTGAFRNLKEITGMKNAILTREPWVRRPDRIGMSIRRWEECGGHWKIQVVLAILVEAMMTSDAPACKLFQ